MGEVLREEDVRGMIWIWTLREGVEECKCKGGRGRCMEWALREGD